jgi:hypothetical protein
MGVDMTATVYTCQRCGDIDARPIDGDEDTFRTAFFWEAYDLDTDPDTLWEHLTGATLAEGAGA